ncbi:hypothetical protein LTR78_005430 [Recurvomyces mirabilis]|uniref:Phenylacetaldoxime dehydratase n=1 Tax=Recurvomyces mirabilis TaxID=574656 RepID=A0AAE0WMU0_9PEZI|nr:hypothetical protein LTR78_005430 [Recurvomyces mirabilis]KAK5152664.1 hypothetical protein LTS14_008198 [Recurvomyces mirabilis]
MGSIGERQYPLKKPAGHKPPVPRWTLKLPEDVSHIYTLYVGVQSRDGKDASEVEKTIEQGLNDGTDKPAAIDTFRVTDGFDLRDSRVWVAYYTSADNFRSKVQSLGLHDLWRSLNATKKLIGLWSEHFTTPVDRLETNYARLDHKPGLAQLPNTEQPSHELTAYWGAGRDRIPASSHDLFKIPSQTPAPQAPPKGLGEHIIGSNYDNMCHIRSGQWWEECLDEERLAYEDDLQKTLMKGMNYLWSNPEETGTIGLRFLQNLDANGKPMKETCGAGFHRNWADLERWSSRHPSHLAIFNGAMKHAKRFGEDRKFMTWHEVSILKQGEASFEYINCTPETGVIRWVDLERRELDM